MIDATNTATFSYIIAIIAIVGLLAIFAFIVRRVASQVKNQEYAQRGRVPRLGIVDTYSLDKDRQLLIVRRDDVEHLLMIGGTNDVVVETNIRRAIGAQPARELSAIGLTSEPDNSPIETLSLAPLNSQPSHLLTTPRLRPAQPGYTHQPQPTKRISDSQEPVGMPFASQANVNSQSPEFNETQNFDTPKENEIVSQATEPPTAHNPSRELLNQSELLALAKRLEASIPQPAALKADVQTAPQVQQVFAPAQMEPISTPQSVSISLKPQLDRPIAPNPPVRQQVAGEPDVANRAMRPNFMPNANPQPTVSRDNLSDPKIQPGASIPMPQPVPMAPPVSQSSTLFDQQAPKDPQTAALDENLRRLLGRKANPK